MTSVLIRDTERERLQEDGCRDRRPRATEAGWTRGDSPLQPSEGAQPEDALLWDLSPPGLLSEGTKFMVVFYSRPRKLIPVSFGGCYVFFPQAYLLRVLLSVIVLEKYFNLCYKIMEALFLLFFFFTLFFLLRWGLSYSPQSLKVLSVLSKILHFFLPKLKVQYPHLCALSHEHIWLETMTEFWGSP